MNQYTKVLVAAAFAVTVSTHSHAVLLNRDMNNEKVMDAFYDTELDITWLRKANVNGSKAWVTANSWAENIIFSGFDD